MGADLIIAIIPAPHFVDGEIVTDFDQIRAQVRERLRTTTTPKLRVDLLQELCMVDNTPKPDQVLDLWVDICEDVINSYGQRDTSMFQCQHGKLYWVTGGMSWGDDPTEAFQSFNAVENLIIFDKPFDKEEVSRKETS